MIQAPDLVRAEARMPRWMYAIALAGTIMTLLLGSPRAAVGFSVGALFGILNYFWIHQAVVAMMNAEKARVPKGIVIKMLLRYPLCFAGIFLIYRTGWSPILAVVGGLLVPGAGVLMESLFLIGAGFRRDELAG
ncbi:MAG TPA: ATP synthase subunit I [Terriglobia bacterium]|nr:ATP synthase subunit I [Terriglobia bacterium]